MKKRTLNPEYNEVSKDTECSQSRSVACIYVFLALSDLAILTKVGKVHSDSLQDGCVLQYTGVSNVAGQGDGCML